MYTISIESKPIKYLMAKDKRLAKVITCIGDIECNYHDDEYEFIIGEIIGQMLSNKVADVIYNRLLEICNNKITVDNILNISKKQLREIGISNAKAEYIINFSCLVKHKDIDLKSLNNMDDKAVMSTLMSIKGIGAWTSKMYLLFVLQRENILPYEDVAFQQSFKWLYKTDECSKETIEKKCEKWSPYSSYAARYLYRALDMGLTKKEFHLYKE